jgi:hypothetical protein
MKKFNMIQRGRRPDSIEVRASAADRCRRARSISSRSTSTTSRRAAEREAAV